MGTPSQPPLDPAAAPGGTQAQAVLDAAFDSVVTMDSAGRIVSANPAAEQHVRAARRRRWSGASWRRR